MSGFKFNPKSVGFDAVNALGLAQAAQLAYADQDTIRKTIDIQWDFPKFRFYNKRGVAGYLAVNDTLILLVFRGTDAGQMSPWTVPDSIALVPCASGNAHKGMAQAFESAWEEVLIAFRLLRNRQQPIWVVGHGLGGGFATLAAQKLAEASLPVSGLYTFGSVRVGDPAFCERLTKELPAVFRLVNDGDTLTRVPSRQMGYDHVGTVIYFDAAGKRHENGTEQWQAFVEQTTGNVADFIQPGSAGWQQHQIGQYVAHLK
jgi:triacylglycerol lipase